MNGAIRVLHLITRPQMRGAETFAVRLATNLEDRGLTNAICSLYTAGEGPDGHFETGDLSRYDLAGKHGLFDRILRVDPFMGRRLGRVLKDFQPDIVLGHGSETLKYASLARTLRSNAKTAYINIGIASFWANNRARIWFNKFWLRNIDCSISVSAFTRSDFVSHYRFDESRAVFIPNAADQRSFDDVADPSHRMQMRQELGVSDDDILIGMVGRFDPGKGQDTLIRATAELISKGLPVHLVLVGEGKQRAELIQQAEDAGITSKLHFLGLRNDVPRVLRGMDIFALASLSEGMPGVLIEAGLSGLPSVAYDTGGVTEVLNHASTGLVVPCGDYEKLVNALEGLCYRSEWRAQIGEQARAWCRRLFDINGVATQYIELFDQLLAGASLKLTVPFENQ